MERKYVCLEEHTKYLYSHIALSKIKCENKEKNQKFKKKIKKIFFKINVYPKAKKKKLFVFHLISQ